MCRRYRVRELTDVDWQEIWDRHIFTRKRASPRFTYLAPTCHNPRIESFQPLHLLDKQTKSTMSLDDKKRKASKMNMEEDPLVLENRRLAQEVDQLRAKLAEYATNSNRATVDQLEQEIAELKKKLADYEDDASNDDDDHESVCDGSAWSVKYFSLKQYKQEHGDCKVPQKYPELGKWVMNMRAAFKNKKIPQDKIDKLNKVSFNWGKGFPDPPSWEDNFQELKKYHDKFGH
mmetsp:Transcript_6966/g.13771  ORF Transcript_6966/g.13771 Transcript_6966/m.13771 type:complete len:232 (+) Transcript_6966:787-1482(+)